MSQHAPDPTTTDDMLQREEPMRSRYEARHLLEACAPYDPPASAATQPLPEGTLRGGMHYLRRLSEQLDDLARRIARELRPPKHQEGTEVDYHPAEVLELAHPPAYQQLLHQVQRLEGADAEVVAEAASLLARAWEQTLLATSSRASRLAGVEAELVHVGRELQEEQARADELLRASRSMQYLSQGGAARFADSYVDVARELVAQLLTEGNEAHGRMVVGVPAGSELMGAGWVPEASGTLRLWFKRPGEHRMGDPCEAILATVEQTHRPTFGISRQSGPDLYRLVQEWARRARREKALACDGCTELLDDLDGLLSGYPRG